MYTHFLKIQNKVREKRNRKTRQDKKKIKIMDKMQTNKSKTCYQTRQSTRQKQEQNKLEQGQDIRKDKSKKRYITQQQK